MAGSSSAHGGVSVPSRSGRARPVDNYSRPAGASGSDEEIMSLKLQIKKYEAEYESASTPEGSKDLLLQLITVRGQNRLIS